MSDQDQATQPATETTAEISTTPTESGSPSSAAPAQQPTSPPDPAAYQAIRQYAMQLEQQLAGSTAGKPQSAPAAVDAGNKDLEEALSKFEQDFGEDAAKALRLLAKSQSPATPQVQPGAQAQQDQQMRSMVEQIEARVQAEALIHTHLDQLAKQPGLAAVIGASRAERQSNPLYAERLQSFNKAVAVQAQAMQQLGVPVDDDILLTIAGMLTIGRTSMPPSSAVADIKGRMVARNDQRLISPAAGGGRGQGQVQGRGRDAAIAWLRDALPR